VDGSEDPSTPAVDSRKLDGSEDPSTPAVDSRKS
jgi:hypothetical protein